MKRSVSSSSNTNCSSRKQMVHCAGCQHIIKERYMLKAVDLLWHEDCLKCSSCECRLGEVGSTLFYKRNSVFCKKDYFRLFGAKGHCSACKKSIPAFEMVMRAKANVYHLECFACQQCNHRFCVGDKFYLADNKILCEYDYEERMVFAKMTYDDNNIAHIRRQTENLTPSVFPNSNGAQQQQISAKLDTKNGLTSVTQQQNDELSCGYESPDSGYSCK